MTIENRHLVEEYGIYSSRKKIIKYRWELIKSYVGWEDYLGFAILVIGILGFIIDNIPYIDELRAELVGIGITVLIIDNANEAIKRREEKKRLILQMGSPDNAFAIEAVRQIRARGWILDGALHQADLGGANLKEAILSVADLRGAHLGGADLSGALLTGANLREAILWGANLSGTNLGVSDLRGADLSGAILSGAILEETDLREANVTPEQLDKAKSLKGAIMPDGTKYNADNIGEGQDKDEI